MSWERKSLGSFVEAGAAEIQTGPFGTQLRASDYVPEGVPVINVRNIGYGDLRSEKLEYVPEELADRMAAHVLESGDIVFGRKGAVDRHLLVTPECAQWMQGSDCIRLRLSGDVLIPRYVSYAMLEEPHKKWMLAQCGNKATMASLNHDVIKRIEIFVPPVPVQREIVGVLTAYDDLIENNRRRIKLLEDSARLLYREWFVHLRFPGHEHVKVVDGVPEGWERRTMAGIAETVGGGTPSTAVSAYWDGGDITWFSPTDLTNNDCLVLLDSGKKITESGLKNSSAKMLPPETILMSSRASIGYFGLHDKPACTNQGFISLIPHDEEYRYYLLYTLLSRKEEIISHAGGTTYKEINKSTFRALPIVWPEADLAAQFGDFAGDVMAQVRVIKRQTEKLRQARDLLLPRLMRGELAV